MLMQLDGPLCAPQWVHITLLLASFETELNWKNNRDFSPSMRWDLLGQFPVHMSHFGQFSAHMSHFRGSLEKSGFSQFLLGWSLRWSQSMSSATQSVEHDDWLIFMKLLVERKSQFQSGILFLRRKYEISEFFELAMSVRLKFNPILKGTDKTAILIHFDVFSTKNMSFEFQVNWPLAVCGRSYHNKI